MAVTTFGDCGGPHDLLLEHSKSSWESKPTTSAEEAVIRFLIDSPPRYQAKSLLHVGIGNGSLFAALGIALRTFTGITISRPELENFNRRFGTPTNVRAILANKHDGRSFELIGGQFDIIVDVNLKSFACCEKHFSATMRYFANSLSRGGVLITAQSGLDFGWAGNTSVAHTPGANTDPMTSSNRILGAEGLTRICRELDLTVERVLVAGPTHSSELLWLVSKG